MAKKYLVYKNTIFVPSIPKEGEPTKFIPIENMAIRTTTETPTIMDLQSTIAFVKEEIKNAQIISTLGFVTNTDGSDNGFLPSSSAINSLYDSATGIVLDDGSVVGSQIGTTAKEDDGIIFISSTGKTETAVFRSTRWIIDNTLNANEESIAALEVQIEEIKQDYITTAMATGKFVDKIIGAMDAGYTPQQLESVTTKAFVDAVAAALNQRLEFIEGTLPDLLRVGDIPAITKIDLNQQPFTEVGDTVEMDLSPYDLTTLFIEELVTIKANPKATSTESSSIYMRDSFNNGKTTPWRFDGVDAEVKISNTKLIITNLNQTKRNTLVTDFEGITLEGIGQAAFIDSVSRQLIQDLQSSKQVQIDAALTAAGLTTSSVVGAIIEVFNNQKNKVSKQLSQGAQADFETFADLKALINDDDLVNIQLASGHTVFGIVTSSGNADDPLEILGMATGIQLFNIAFGKISISKTFDITESKLIFKQPPNLAYTTVINLIRSKFQDGHACFVTIDSKKFKVISFTTPAFVNGAVVSFPSYIDEGVLKTLTAPFTANDNNFFELYL